MSGKVYLVGAGPGDPELLTLRALKLLGLADTIVCDRLVGPSVLQYANPQAQFHDVGKIPGCRQHQQDEINQLLLTLARSRQRIVRLKGGDPFIFGRGGEELLFLVQHGIEVEVVPGITAATGCAAAVGIPLTHRGVAASVRFITGHLRDSDGLELDWRSLVDPTCTLVFYMAVSNAATIVEALIAHGRPADTPAALIHAGTMAEQDCAVVTLQEVPGMIDVFAPPTLLVIGEVVRLYSSPAKRALEQAGPTVPHSFNPPLSCPTELA
ncbi:uroporphyrinogen-III C-methyltransferase [Pseudomonas veronii]|uniref:uroporphyrinogen-III C-methyltransferase n=1 Tax=Pseudomonas veronii TaxID=76761 RepID=UPI0021BFE8A6|nr:uroporphyrinogen-III C-methyltransferase [Pseudomonas veronii]MCT8962810.1 uroporphyrinogen-III C-methyltransferase [Pseudomonas veronii]